MSHTRQHHTPPRDNTTLHRRAQAAWDLVMALAIAAALAICLAYWATCDVC